MTNPNRDDAVRGLFATLQTEDQETLTAARGAVDRQAAIIADLQTQIGNLAPNVLSDAALTEFTTTVASLKQSSDDAQAAFDAVGVPVTPVAAHKRGKHS